MSMNFSANQYERSFRAERLGNWEVSKWYPHVKPRQRKGHTKIIADDRGHLLPGVPRIEPWGHFRSTWQLPRRITRNIAKELSIPTRIQRKPQTSWEKRSLHIPLVDPKQGLPSLEAKQSSPTESKTTPISLPPANKEKRTHSGKKEIPVVDDEDVEKLNNYQPYDKDEHDFTHPMGCDGNTKVVDTAKRVREDIESYTKNCRTGTEKKSSLETLMSNNGKNSLDVLRANNYNKEVQDILEEKDKLSEDSGKASSKRSSARSSRSSSKSSRSSTGSKKEDLLLKSPPLVTDYISAKYARDLAQNNLKHQPLPDTVHHQAFKALQMKKSKHPGIALENMPQAVAVGHKKFVSPGPTQCSKLKVYRPKTAGEVNGKSSPLEQIERPKTCRIKDLHEIDLALCWDLVAEDEPKRPVHIDGSNGSIAPSVFAVVKPKSDDQEQQQQQQQKEKKKPSSAETKCKDPRHKPKTAWAENIKPPKIIDRTVNPSAVMDIINMNDEVTANADHLRRPSQTSNHRSTSSHGSRKGSTENRCPNIPAAEERPASKHSSHEEEGSKKSSQEQHTLDTSLNSDKFVKRKLYSSSPNLTAGRENHLASHEHHNLKSSHSRPCVACDIKTLNDSVRKPKSDYKMAFKAGVPNSVSNSSKSGSQPSTNKSLTMKPLSIPKPKTPFARKGYSINTLIPPFSLWPGTTGMDYPEHWRLASVYQHSYKPVEQRKKTLLQSVFH